MGLDLSWFQEGLKFKCTGCGKCCTGSPGYVYLSHSDIQTLAEHLSLSTEEFTKNYTRWVEDGYALLDSPGSSDCIFLKDQKCTAYTARPTQCRTFPWWPQNLRSPEDWQKAAVHCEGISHTEAPLVSSIQIQSECLTYLDNLLERNFR